MSFRRNNLGQFNNELGRGYNRPNQQPMNPWNTNSDFIGQSGGSNLNMNNATSTLALANNLISTLLGSTNKMLPSLLDVNPMNSAVSQGYGGNMNQGMNNMYNSRNPQQQNRIANYNSAANRLGPIRNRVRNFKPTPTTNKNQGANNKSKQGNSFLEKKRDARNEQKKQNQQTSPAKKVEPKNKTADGKDSEVKTESEYSDIDQMYLNCHICKKHMWDGVSFKKHLLGLAHKMMLESTAESYVIQAQMIRHENRVAENARQIEKDRKRRVGWKQGVQQQQQQKSDYCTMCDLRFSGSTLTLHRHSKGHAKLKGFLHPKCEECEQEFANRIDWDEHLLTPDHMRKLAELGVVKILSVEEESKNSAEQIDIAEAFNIAKLNKLAQLKKVTDKTAEKQDETIVKSENESDVKETTPAVKEESPETDKLIDFCDLTDLTGVTVEQLPSYDPTRAVGMSFVEERKCYFCTICFVHFLNEEASQVHLKSLKHHDRYMWCIKRQLNKAKWKAEKSRKAQETSVEEREDDDSAGHWKRRKTANSTSKDDGSATEVDATRQEETNMYEPEESLREDETQNAADEIEKLMDDVNNEDILQNEDEFGDAGDVILMDGGDLELKKEECVAKETEKAAVVPEEKTTETKLPEPDTSEKNETTAVLKKELTVAVEDVAKIVETAKKPVPATPTRNVARGGPRARRGTPRRN